MFADEIALKSINKRPEDLEVAVNLEQTLNKYVKYWIPKHEQ